MSNKPKVLINIFLINFNGDKILFLKKHINPFWELIGEKLNYGEKFNDCIKRVLFSEVNLSVDENRIKFLCSYNAVNKTKNKHFVSINYCLQLTENEELKEIYFGDKYQSWKWMTFEEIIKMKDSLFFGIDIFIKNYHIASINDIINLKAN